MDPTVTFAPGHTNYLSGSTPSTTAVIPTQTDAPIPPQTPLIRQLHRRDRSRSRDRLPLTTLANPHLVTQPRQPLANITSLTAGQRGHLHHALWTASMTPTTLLPDLQHTIPDTEMALPTSNTPPWKTENGIFSSITLCLFFFPYTLYIFFLLQPFDLTQLARPLYPQRYLPSMEHESPDWDRSPSVVMETKDETFEPPQITAKSETSSTKEAKFEDTKKEEDSPSNSAFLCPPVNSLPDTSTPPAKAPPVPHASYRSNSQNRLLAADHRCHQTQGRSATTIHYILHQQ